MHAPAVRLHLFGSPMVESGGVRTALPLERRIQLVVLLALRRQWVPRAEIAAMLWPEQEDRLAFANLRKTLFRLQALPWAAAIELQGAALRLEMATDVADFEAALRVQRASEALAGYRGELLAGFDDSESEAWTRWVGFERDRLRTAWRAAALARLADPALEPAEAVALSARLLEADPLDEAALRQHMSALARDGQAGAARAAYRQFVERLSTDLGLTPGAELRALHDALTGARPLAAGIGVAAVSPADDGFVGRSAELKRIADLLARDECRLLCLIGPGGVGKTRLARRTMQELAPRYADGAVFVPLEDVDTPEQLGLRLAREGGVAAASGNDDPLTRVIDAWREQQLLLVLDNFEQLAEHAGVLDRLLQACARLKIVVTSRLRLAVAGEWSMPLEGLPVPDPEDEDRAESFDAVRLFVKAARRVEPDFAAAAEVAAIVDVCRQVEGLPLAIELAAGWARMLSCRAIADELRFGTELLRAADTRHPPRHASIEAVFEHSWRRLSEVEREALSRLSVFHGGFSMEGAREVAGASLPVLGALADKSLLAKDGDRMHLHPLVQQLAALRLGDEAARASTEAAHSAHLHRWLRQLEPASESGDREALQAIDRDFENCRRACQFSIARSQGEALKHSLPTLLNYFEHRARFAEGLALFQQAIESPLAADRPLLALLLSQAALMQTRLARYAEAEATATRALAATRRGQPRQARYQALAVLGGCAVFTGRYVEAREAYQQVLLLAQAGGRAYEIASTLDNLALCEKRLGRYDESLRLMREALLQHRRHGDNARLALCLNNLASISTFMNDDESAKLHLHEALQISERHGLVSSRAFVLANLTELALKVDDVDTARTHAESALQVAQGAGLMALAAWLKLQLSRLATRRGELELARSLLADGADLALTLGAQSVKPATLLALAELLEAQGQAGAARRVLAFGADEETLSVPDREELRAAWARRASAAPADPPWPGIALGDLLQRIVAERVLGHAPLIAALQVRT